MSRVRYSSFIALFGFLLLSMASGCGADGNANADPEYLELQKAKQEQLKSDPELQKKAEERKQRQI